MVKIRGDPLTGTNIVDLVGDVVRSASSKTSAPQRERFFECTGRSECSRNAREEQKGTRTLSAGQEQRWRRSCIGSKQRRIRR